MTRAEKIAALVAAGLKLQAERNDACPNPLPREGLERASDKDLDELFITYVSKTDGQRVADVLERHGITRVTVRGGEARDLAHLDNADELGGFDRAAVIRELIVDHRVHDVSLGDKSDAYLHARLFWARARPLGIFPGLDRHDAIRFLREHGVTPLDDKGSDEYLQLTLASTLSPLLNTQPKADR
jgi:hypothetical protein